jgi:hypothetical protein
VGYCVVILQLTDKRAIERLDGEGRRSREMVQADRCSPVRDEDLCSLVIHCLQV